MIGVMRWRSLLWHPARASRGAWLMLGGAFAAFTVSSGLMHSYAVFLVAFIEEFRWSRAETSIAYSVSQLVAGASSPLVGALVDRLGPRRLLLLGGSLLVLGLLASAFISALWQIILLYGVVMTIGANCLGLVVFVPLLSRHFVRRRGMAISIVQSANGFGRAASAPLVQLLISTLGWRETYLAQAAFMAAVVPFLASRFGADRAAATRMELGRGCAHAPFLAALRGLPVHRARQFPRLVASARLCRRSRIRQALRRRGARAGQLSCHRRHDLHRHALGLCRAGALGDPGLRHFDPRRGLRLVDHRPRPRLAIVAARLLLRFDMGRPRPRDHSEDRRPLSRPSARDHPWRDYDRQRHRFRCRVMGSGLDLRPLRQLSARLHAVDRRLSLRLHRLLGLAPTPHAVSCLARTLADAQPPRRQPKRGGS